MHVLPKQSTTPAPWFADGAFGGRVDRATGTAVVRESLLPWDRPADQQAQVEAAGLELADAESLTVHYHAHLDVTVDGTPVAVPAGLGINAGPGGSLPAHVEPGIAVLHTHDTTGTLHVEAPAAERFTLGQVFTEWGIVLGPGQVGGYRTGKDSQVVTVTVDGATVPGDPARIVLADGQRIAVIVARRPDTSA